MKPTLKVAITGAAGQLAYSLIFRIASGAAFGADCPVELRLLEIPNAMAALEGVAMEIDDCAFPLVRGVHLSDSPAESFEGIHWGLLVGSRPRGPGMERADLLQANGKIFIEQGKALSKANPALQVLVVGNPANTNCLIALNQVKDIPSERFHAMMRLDHNRAMAQVASKAEVTCGEVDRMIVWGNHSATQFPDTAHVQIKDKALSQYSIDSSWLEGEFITTVQQRGGTIIKARGVSSAASAANAAVDHVHTMVNGTKQGSWTSSAVLSDGSYGCPKGIVSSFPLTVQAPKNGNPAQWEVVPNLELSDFAKQKIQASWTELEQERKMVKDLLG